MFILAFSLNWFTTIPGILISLGVVLLIIALILFIVGGKKTKKEEVAVVNNEVEPAMEDASISDVTPIADIDVSAVEVQPELSVEEPKFEDIQIGTPGIDPINPVEFDVTSTDELAKVEETNEIQIEEPNSQDLDKTMVSVYGEESSTEEEPKVTIYGGNDPLEATQNLPKVDEHHEPYGGAINEVKIVEPVEDTVVQIPEVEPVVVPTEPTEIPSEPIEVPSEPVEVESQPAIVFDEPVVVPSEPVVVPSESVEVPSEPTEVSNEAVEPAEEEKTVVEEL